MTDEDSPTPLSYSSPPRRIRGAHIVVRVIAGAAAAALVLYAAGLLDEDRLYWDHPLRMAALTALAGAAFLACAAAGLVGTRKAS
jgi:hypothetical protein